MGPGIVWMASHRLGSTTPGATADAENGRKSDQARNH